MNDHLDLLIELEEAGVRDIRRDGDRYALLLPPHVQLADLPVRLRAALEARRHMLLPMLRPVPNSNPIVLIAF